ncbi:MAG TPA: amidohydrolase family protein [Candidatus Avacidaminococcus intestinavium]|uniref:Amidohydrolase family protein n=1 Tax=Candidatus Avacidaminococcus intestinavium TaxID=2840684 RepID=A0A9D1MQ39_9FIRM|nr:amidohydrolase family protein [Candidatus Avacidaminococcus intestinavium]
MKIIDAHMHYYNTEGFYLAAQQAGHENSSKDYAEICARNNIVFSIAMGNADGEIGKFGGSTPRVPNLAGTFDYLHYNQPANIGYCAGVKSEEITSANALQTAFEFKRYLEMPQCVGIKFYPGYRHVYIHDAIHDHLFELAEELDVPVVVHTGDTSIDTALLKYAHPLTIDEAAVKFPRVRIVIAHCGNPWLVDAVEVAAKNQNVYLELSALAAGNFDSDKFYNEHKAYYDYISMWLNYYGQYDKIIYGSDWPLVNIDNYIKLMCRVIPEKHQEGFFYKNALKIFTKVNKLL